jgi:hypothetical protein
VPETDRGSGQVRARASPCIYNGELFWVTANLNLHRNIDAKQNERRRARRSTAPLGSNLAVSPALSHVLHGPPYRDAVLLFDHFRFWIDAPAKVIDGEAIWPG